MNVQRENIFVITSATILLEVTAVHVVLATNLALTVEVVKVHYLSGWNCC